uniref:Secreted protein n=1 Tax=Haemonchus contortus TaxID=6289 RepID=A0A7I4YC55_HAECO
MYVYMCVCMYVHMYMYQRALQGKVHGGAAGIRNGSSSLVEGSVCSQRGHVFDPRRGKTMPSRSGVGTSGMPRLTGWAMNNTVTLNVM